MANERWLIDANALREIYAACRESRRFWDSRFFSAMDEAIKDLDRQPTVDAVEVIRCRECKHYRSGEPSPGTSYCARLPYYAGAGGLNVGDEDYCSFGERREEQKEEST